MVRRYGLQPGQYQEMLDAQLGRCAICGNMPRRLRLAVDHDHVTGEVRGLLCSRCNRGLGPFEASLIASHNASVYLMAIHETRLTEVIELRD